MGMAKICDNCACYEVCIYANPNRTKDCTLWQPEMKWIPVSERLPDENDVAEYIEKYSYAPEFLVMIKGATEPTVLLYDGELWSCDLGQTYDVTHWMPLPELPKEE